MHTYNPLELPETIAEIIQYLPEEDLEICSGINNTWYKEVERELYKRLKHPEDEFQKIILQKEENSNKWESLLLIEYPGRRIEASRYYDESEYLKEKRVRFFRKKSQK